MRVGLDVGFPGEFVRIHAWIVVDLESSSSRSRKVDRYSTAAGAAGRDLERVIPQRVPAWSQLEHVLPRGDPRRVLMDRDLKRQAGGCCLEQGSAWMEGERRRHVVPPADDEEHTRKSTSALPIDIR